MQTAGDVPDVVHPSAWSHSGKRLADVLSYLILTAGVITLGIAVRLAIASYCRLPWSDMWTALNWFVKPKVSAWHWLWLQHNEHRILVPKLILLVDLNFFKARDIFPLSCIFVVITLHALLLIWACSRWGLRGKRLRTAIGLILFCTFSPAQWENFVSGFHIAILLPGLFGSISLVSLLLHPSREESSKSWQWGLVATAVVAGLAATYSLGNGILIWPVLFVVALLKRIGKAALAALAISGILTGVFYFYHYNAGPPDNVPSALHKPLQLAGYILVYVGSPWAAGSTKWALIFGVLGLVISASAWAQAVARSRQPIILFLSAWMLLSCGTAALTSLGRVYMGSHEALSGRYQTFPLLLWMAVGLFFLWNSRKSNLLLLALQVALLAALIQGANHLHFFFTNSDNRRLTVNTASLAIVTGANDRAALAQLFPNPDMIWQDIPLLKARGLSVFATDLAKDFNQPLRSGYRLTGVSCRGDVDNVTILPATSPPGIKVEGWAWNTSSRRPPSEVIFAAGDKIVGYAEVGFSRLELPARLGSAHALKAGWNGYVEPIQGPQQVEVYGVINSRHKTICQVSDAIIHVPPEQSKPDLSAKSAVRAR